MAMEWTREKTLMLIDEYQKRRGLWDMTHEDYRKKSVKRQLLSEVAEKINMKVPTNEIEKKFHTLRTQYHREINRMKQFSGDEYKSKWFAFRHLEFLSSPKACRGSKTDAKGEKSLNIKKENYSPTTYIIKQLQQEHESSHNSIDVKQENQLLIQDQHSTTATEFLSIPKKIVMSNKRDNSESRKDFEKLIQETTKDVEEIEDVMIDQSDYKLRLKTIPIQHNYTAQNIQTIDHFIDEQDDDQTQAQESSGNTTILHNDENEYQTQGAQTAIIRIQKRDLSAIEKISYEEPYETKRIKCNASSSVRDEYAIYGEYVANEMRMITAKEILINLKHKINLALFEANMSQLNKERLQ